MTLSVARKCSNIVHNLLHVYSERNYSYFGAFLIFCCAPMSSVEVETKEINKYCLRFLAKVLFPASYCGSHSFSKKVIA